MDFWATFYGVHTVQTPDNVVPLHVHCFFLDQLLSHEGTSYLQHLENSRNKIFACIIQYNSILNWNFLEKYYQSNIYERYFTSYFEFYRIKFRIFHQRQIALLRLITTNGKIISMLDKHCCFSCWQAVHYPNINVKVYLITIICFLHKY